LTTSSTIPAGAGGGWQTFGVAKAEGWAWWGPEAMVWGQSMANPTKLRAVVSMTQAFGNGPFDTVDGGNPGDFYVDWELCCFDNLHDPINTLVCKSGDWDTSGQTRITKKWASMKGTPLASFEHCDLKVEAAMGGTGEVKVKTEAKY
jgi:hypothetical protein